LIDRAIDAVGGIATSGLIPLTVAPPPTFRWAASGFVLEAVTIPGRSYRLESRTELESGSWSKVSTTLALESLTRWDAAFVSMPRAFWRMIVVSPAPGAQ
jgi:hypothetical protein